MEHRRDRERRVRELRYFSPPSMVEAVTRRRLAGDWRGACAAGRVDVDIDLRKVAARHGGEAAARIEADLVGFAPDLLRRFLPRADDRTLARQGRIVLSRLQTPFSEQRQRRWPPLLLATLPDRDGSRQRIGLAVADVDSLTGSWFDLPDWCWHAAAVDARRWAYGASPTRLAWHTVDGRPYRQGESTPRDQPRDRAFEVETLTGLLEAQRVTEAYEAAGFAIGPSGEEDWRRRSFAGSLAALGPALPVLAAETRRLAHRYRLTSVRGLLASSTTSIDVTGDGRLIVRASNWRADRDRPAVFGVRAPVDVALLRWGALGVDELHPLVHEALFPQRVQQWRAPAPAVRPAIRVRCGADWHSVRAEGGRLLTPEHTDEEIRREFLLAGLGGTMTGCAAALRAWRTGAKPVPKEIRKIRRDLFATAVHGDTDTLLDLLAAGIDPGLRDGRGNTLMHYLHHLDHARALPFFVAAGLSLDARNEHDSTPLHAAAACAATEVVDALIAAGADTAAVNAWRQTPADVLAQIRKQAKR